MHWSEVVTVFAVIATNLGTVITLYVHSDKKIDAIHETIKAIQLEMKDFHGRLCTIEERNKNGR